MSSVEVSSAASQQVLASVGHAADNDDAVSSDADGWDDAWDDEDKWGDMQV